jgi:hypothetical protein
MADLPRVAKCGNQWTTLELAAFNISIVPQTVDSFFGRSNLPNPSVTDTILTRQELTKNLRREEREFFIHLYNISRRIPDRDSGVRDFTSVVLRLLHYDDTTQGFRIMSSKREMDFEMCAKRVKVHTDLILAEQMVHGWQYLLLMLEDRVSDRLCLLPIFPFIPYRHIWGISILQSLSSLQRRLALSKNNEVICMSGVCLC